MDRIIERGMLYDFYGELLTEHQRQVYGALVMNNMSLSEIAEEYNVSRQGVHDLIKRCDKILNNYEDKLCLIRRFKSVREKVCEIESITDDERVRGLVDQILEEM